jgi:hypothetical protein
MGMDSRFSLFKFLLTALFCLPNFAQLFCRFLYVFPKDCSPSLVCLATLLSVCVCVGICALCIHTDTHAHTHPHTHAEPPAPPPTHTHLEPCTLFTRLTAFSTCRRVFDAFNNLDSAAFHHTLILAAQLVLADTVFGLAGRCVLEMFARNTMREVFQRFFQHLIYQVSFHLISLGLMTKDPRLGTGRGRKFWCPLLSPLAFY